MPMIMLLVIGPLGTLFRCAKYSHPTTVPLTEILTRRLCPHDVELAARLKPSAPLAYGTCGRTGWPSAP